MKRHVPATTSVEVYRLFKLRDLGGILRDSTDPLIRAIGQQVYFTASGAVGPYVDQQNAIVARAKRKVKKATKKAK